MFINRFKSYFKRYININKEIDIKRISKKLLSKDIIGNFHKFQLADPLTADYPKYIKDLYLSNKNIHNANLYLDCILDSSLVEKDFDEVNYFIDEILYHYPKNAKFNYAKGLILEILNNKKEALKHYQISFEINFDISVAFKIWCLLEGENKKNFLNHIKKKNYPKVKQKISFYDIEKTSPKTILDTIENEGLIVSNIPFIKNAKIFEKRNYENFVNFVSNFDFNKSRSKRMIFFDEVNQSNKDIYKLINQITIDVKKNIYEKFFNDIRNDVIDIPNRMIQFNNNINDANNFSKPNSLHQLHLDFPRYCNYNKFYTFWTPFVKVGPNISQSLQNVQFPINFPFITGSQIKKNDKSHNLNLVENKVFQSFFSNFLSEPLELDIGDIFIFGSKILHKTYWDQNMNSNRYSIDYRFMLRNMTEIKQVSDHL